LGILRRLAILLIGIGAVLPADVRAEVVLHVDAASEAAAPEASSEQAAAAPAGSEQSPFGKLQTALEHAVALSEEDAVTILVRPGVYRESIRFQLPPGSPRLRIAAVEPGTAVISGADPIVA